MIDKSIPLPSWWFHSEKSWYVIQDFFASREILSADSWHKIRSGQSNHNYCLDLLEARYFIQISEQQNQQLRPKLGKCPNLYSIKKLAAVHHWLIPCRLNSDRVRVFDWFDGQAVKSEEINDKQLLESLLDFLVTLHKLSDVQTDTSTLLPLMNIQQYIERYRTLAKKHHQTETVDIDSLSNQAIQLAHQYQPSCICHNDLSVGNLLWQQTTGELKIVDWEYACIGDPLMDLASLFINCQLNIDQRDWFIGKYQSQMESQLDLDKLDKMRRLAEIINKIWYMAWEKR